MATGDDALAAGMAVMTGNEPANTLDTEVNKTRDYIAQRTNAVQPLAKGGTGGTTAAAARANLNVAAANEVVKLGATGNQITLRWENGRIRMRVDSTEVGDVANTGDISGLSSQLAAKANASQLNSLYEGNLSPNIYSRGTSGSWRSMAIQSNGVLAQTASAARYKKNIKALPVTDEQIKALRLVEFDWRSDGVHDVGVIADEVKAAGLDEFVFHNDDGQIQGVHYERLAMALIPVVQRLLTRVEALEVKDAA